MQDVLGIVEPHLAPNPSLRVLLCVPVVVPSAVRVGICCIRLLAFGLAANVILRVRALGIARCAVRVGICCIRLLAFGLAANVILRVRALGIARCAVRVGTCCLRLLALKLAANER